MIKRIIFIVVILFITTLYAQDLSKHMNNNPRTQRPFGLSINLGGPTYITSLSMDYFVFPYLNIETGGGIYGYYFGSKYHFKGCAPKVKTTLYTGFILSVFPPLRSVVWPSNWIISKPKTHLGAYVPVGISNISGNGYTFSIEVAYNSKTLSPALPFWFALKFGYHF
jgi:hypothetical protein